MSEPIRVGPTFEQCPECGETSDGYGLIVHDKACVWKNAERSRPSRDPDALLLQRLAAANWDGTPLFPEKYRELFRRIADRLNANWNDAGPSSEGRDA